MGRKRVVGEQMKKTVSYFLVVCLLLLFSGCSAKVETMAPYSVSVSEVKDIPSILVQNGFVENDNWYSKLVKNDYEQFVYSFNLQHRQFNMTKDFLSASGDFTNDALIASGISASNTYDLVTRILVYNSPRSGQYQISLNCGYDNKECSTDYFNLATHTRIEDKMNISSNSPTIYGTVESLLASMDLDIVDINAYADSIYGMKVMDDMYYFPNLLSFLEPLVVPKIDVESRLIESGYFKEGNNYINTIEDKLYFIDQYFSKLSVYDEKNQQVLTYDLIYQDLQIYNEKEGEGYYNPTTAYAIKLRKKEEEALIEFKREIIVPELTRLKILPEQFFYANKAAPQQYEDENRLSYLGDYPVSINILYPSTVNKVKVTNAVRDYLDSTSWILYFNNNFPGDSSNYTEKLSFTDKSFQNKKNQIYYWNLDLLTDMDNKCSYNYSLKTGNCEEETEIELMGLRSSYLNWMETMDITNHDLNIYGNFYSLFEKDREISYLP